MEVEHAGVLPGVVDDDYPCGADMRTPTAAKAEIRIDGDLATEAWCRIVRCKWVRERHTARLQANERFAELAQ
jgi:hypothetical protein